MLYLKRIPKFSPLSPQIQYEEQQELLCQTITPTEIARTRINDIKEFLRPSKDQPATHPFYNIHFTSHPEHGIRPFPNMTTPLQPREQFTCPTCRAAHEKEYTVLRRVFQHFSAFTHEAFYYDIETSQGVEHLQSNTFRYRQILIRSKEDISPPHAMEITTLIKYRSQHDTPCKSATTDIEILTSTPINPFFLPLMQMLQQDSHIQYNHTTSHTGPHIHAWNNHFYHPIEPQSTIVEAPHSPESMDNSIDSHETPHVVRPSAPDNA